MKKVILLYLFSLTSLLANSQSDTLFSKKQGKIPCKIIEIAEFEIRYQLAENLNGPLYVVNKSTIYKYTLANGFTELLLPDELSLENEHEAILKNRNVIKIHPFSAVNNQLSFAYEKVIKVGMNLDTEFGYINYGINTSGLSGYSGTGISYSGAYVKPGIKFFLGQDFSVKGLKYAHPLKGRYIRLDLAMSFMYYQNIVSSSRSGTYPNLITTTYTTSSNIFSYGGFVNYGRQFILGNALTMEYFVGAGFTGLSYTYSNPDFRKKIQENNYLMNNVAANTSNFHAFMRVPNLGLSFTAGFRVGYILPEKKRGPRKSL